MNNNLKTTYCGISLSHPVMLAPSSLTETAERIARAHENGASGAVMKTLFYKETDENRKLPSPHFKQIPMKDHQNNLINGISALYSCEFPNAKGVDEYVAELKRSVEFVPPDFPIFASLQCFGGDLAGWGIVASRIERTGVKGLELNFSMPISHAEIFESQWEIGEMAEIVNAVKESAPNLKIAVKLSPYTSRLLDVVTALRYMGADAVVLFNRVAGLDFIINPDNPDPILHKSYAGYGGPWVLYSNLAQVAHIYNEEKKRGNRPSICGSGGILTWQDVIKYILAGASAVQVCTSALRYGYEIIQTIVTELEKEFSTGILKNYTISRLCGEGAKRVREANEIDRKTRQIALVDSTKCKGCGDCVKVCFRDAIKRLNAGSPVIIDPNSCIGCGLCTEIFKCPNEARSLQPTR